MTATIHQLHPCPNCVRAQRITAAVENLDPDRLANRVRAELRTGTADDIDLDVILYGGGELAVDIISGDVWHGLWTRTPQEQLNLALVHLAAALAAGARSDQPET